MLDDSCSLLFPTNNTSLDFFCCIVSPAWLTNLFHREECRWNNFFLLCLEADHSSSTSASSGSVGPNEKPSASKKNIWPIWCGSFSFARHFTKCKSGSNTYKILHAESNKWIINSAKQANYQIKWRFYGRLLTCVTANWTRIQSENGSSMSRSWPHPSLFTLYELLGVLLMNVAKPVNTGLNVRSICCSFPGAGRYPVQHSCFMVLEVVEATWALIGLSISCREFKPKGKAGKCLFLMLLRNNEVCDFWF